MKNMGNMRAASGMISPLPAGKFHGSPKESHKFSMEAMSTAGKMSGDGTTSTGPGKAARKVKGDTAGGHFKGGAKTSGKTKGMKTWNQE